MKIFVYVEELSLMTDEEFKDLVNRLVEKISINKLASALCVSRPTVSRWMRGVTAPHELARKPLQRLAKRLGILED